MPLEYRYREPARTGLENEKPPLLVLLHGIGADENDLFALAPHLDERFFVASARAPFVLPYGGFAWFELMLEPGSPVGVNVRQFEQSRELIFDFIEELVGRHKPDPEKIFLGGFSQGAMMTLSAVLRQPERFAGAVAMSGRAMPEMLPADGPPAGLKNFPVFVAHGIYDPVLPIDNGRATREILSGLPIDLKYKEYPMAHEISPQSLEDVSRWLRSRLDG